MSEVKLTPEQNEAIHSSGKNILVSASAGSGVYWPPPFQVFKHGAGFVLNGDFLRKITNPRIAGGYGAAV